MKDNTIHTQNGQMMPVLVSDISMSSKEISDLLNIRHDVVVRQIKRLAGLGTIEFPQIVEISTATKPRTEHLFSGEQGKRDSIIVVAQLSPEVTAKLVDRWQELEAEVQQPSVPQDLPSALRLAADLAEENHKLTHENAELEQTKAQISRNREAVVMGRLGAATKKIKKLEIMIGDAEEFKQVKAIPWIKDYFKTNKSGAWSQIGKALSSIERHNDVPPKYIEDHRYGKVKVYPLFVIQIFKDKLDSEKNYLAKYRKVGVAA